MKKLLGIVVLGLLFSGCGASYYQEQAKKDTAKATRIENDRVKQNAAYKNLDPDIDMIRVRFSFYTGFDKNHASNICASKNKFYFYFSDSNMLEKLRTKSEADGVLTYCSSTNLTVDPIYGFNPIGFDGFRIRNKLEFTNFDPSIAQRIKKDKPRTKIQKKKTLASLKNTCKEFGYKEGTEKFADCLKDLYLKESDNQNQTLSQTIPVTPKSKRKIDPSVWDDIISLSTGVMNGSSKSKTPKQVCFRKGQEKIGFGKSCRYSCTGSLYTMMVGSLELCPLTIER